MTGNRSQGPSPCFVTAGICPKPARTYGEPHYCDLIHGHEGWPFDAHHCRQCGTTFNAHCGVPPEMLAQRIDK